MFVHMAALRIWYFMQKAFYFLRRVDFREMSAAPL